MTAIATTSELLAAFAQLSHNDHSYIRSVTFGLLDGTPYSETDDLLHEALHRCLRGSRSWPKHVPFPVFIANAMRSVAGAERRRKSARTTRPESHYVTDSFINPLEYFADRSPSAEDVYIALLERVKAEDELDRLTREFESDPTALAALQGWLSDLRSQEIIEQNQLTLKAYDAARKRLHRSIAAQRKRREG